MQFARPDTPGALPPWVDPRLVDECATLISQSDKANQEINLEVHEHRFKKCVSHGREDSQHALVRTTRQMLGFGTALIPHDSAVSAHAMDDHAGTHPANFARSSHSPGQHEEGRVSCEDQPSPNPT